MAITDSITDRRASFTPTEKENGKQKNEDNRLKENKRGSKNTFSQCRKFNCICSSRLRADLYSWKTLNVYIYSLRKNIDVVFSTSACGIIRHIRLGTKLYRSYRVTVNGRPMSFSPFWHSYDMHAHAVTRNMYLWHIERRCLECRAALACNLLYSPPRVPNARCLDPVLRGKVLLFEVFQPRTRHVY